jgi:hypothetical protein
MTAYRVSHAYDAGNGASLLTTNLALIAFFIALIAVFAARHIRQKNARKDKKM